MEAHEYRRMNLTDKEEAHYCKTGMIGGIPVFRFLTHLLICNACLPDPSEIEGAYFKNKITIFPGVGQIILTLCNGYT